ncbi:MAG TPA: hypothetical protein VH024_17490 [Candidatus Angelobacter sp.]|jgi:hypothetical protein|nr:hypothetical protein [Candidatus Angelobacter sp.]
MTYQYGVTLRTNKVAQIQQTIGSSGTLKIFSGAEPANCAAADPAGLLCTITLPATFLTSAAGVTTIAGSWAANASATGTAASFRMYDGSSVCHVQGNVTTDLVLNSTSLTNGQQVSVTSFSVTAGNA